MLLELPCTREFIYKKIECIYTKKVVTAVPFTKKLGYTPKKRVEKKP